MSVCGSVVCTAVMCVEHRHSRGEGTVSMCRMEAESHVHGVGEGLRMIHACLRQAATLRCLCACDPCVPPEALFMLNVFRGF